MSSIYFLIACSIFVALLFLIAFLWAQKSGQNDDLYTPSLRILVDDETTNSDSDDNIVKENKQ